MTVSDIQNYTSSKLGMTDSVTKAQALTFITARHKMIWNAALWKQARWQATVSVNASQQDVTLPSEFEFATAVRWADGKSELFPTTDLAAFSQNPQGYDAAGTVGAFARLARDGSGNEVLRLFQVPQTAQSMLVLGKRKCVDMVNPTDPTLIPGEDECLCAFVMGDLYQWLRQFGKAQQFFQEATTLLQKMVEIEIGQTAGIIQLVPMEQQFDYATVPDFLEH